MRELFWEGRDRTDKNRELFLKGLLKLTESLNDKTLGEGYVQVTRGHLRNLEFFVALGERARENLLKPTLQYVADKYRMPQILLRGEYFLADHRSQITVVLPDSILAVAKFPERFFPIRVIKRSLECFEDDMRAVCTPPFGLTTVPPWFTFPGGR